MQKKVDSKIIRIRITKKEKDLSSFHELKFSYSYILETDSVHIWFLNLAYDLTKLKVSVLLATKGWIIRIMK